MAAPYILNQQAEEEFYQTHEHGGKGKADLFLVLQVFTCSSPNTKKKPCFFLKIICYYIQTKWSVNGLEEVFELTGTILLPNKMPATELRCQ